MYVCTYVRTYVRTYVCMYVYIHIYIYIYICIIYIFFFVSSKGWVARAPFLIDEAVRCSFHVHVHVHLNVTYTCYTYIYIYIYIYRERERCVYIYIYVHCFCPRVGRWARWDANIAMRTGSTRARPRSRACSTNTIHTTLTPCLIIQTLL